MVGIKIGLAEARKMLDGAKNPCTTKSGEKLPSIGHGLFGIGRNRARTHDLPRCLKRQINDRRKIRVKAQRAARLADDFAMLAKQLPIAASEHVGGRGSRASNIPKAINHPAFHIDASE